MQLLLISNENALTNIKFDWLIYLAALPSRIDVLPGISVVVGKTSHF